MFVIPLFTHNLYSVPDLRIKNKIFGAITLVMYIGYHYFEFVMTNEQLKYYGVFIEAGIFISIVIYAFVIGIYYYRTLQEKMKKVEEATKKYKDHSLNIAVAYGGQQEIIDACKEISMKVSEGLLKPGQINEILFRESLYTNGFRYPDLIIRTGGERRLSNFLLWQSAYSELAFTDERWPDFSKQNFLKIINDYQKRDRRFGK